MLAMPQPAPSDPVLQSLSPPSLSFPLAPPRERTISLPLPLTATADRPPLHFLFRLLPCSFWLVLVHPLEHTDIIPFIKSDHSAITLQINTIEDKIHSPSHWMFISSLLDDDNYTDLICSSFEDMYDKQLLWDFIKYRIRQITISFSKEKAKERRNNLVEIENKLKESKVLCATDLTEKNIEEFEKSKIEYDSMYDYITQGNIIRSKATWYEKGEKNNKYFLSLEKSRNTKNCIRKLFNKEGREIINSKAIMPN